MNIQAIIYSMDKATIQDIAAQNEADIPATKKAATFEREELLKRIYFSKDRKALARIKH